MLIMWIPQSNEEDVEITSHQTKMYFLSEYSFW